MKWQKIPAWIPGAAVVLMIALAWGNLEQNQLDQPPAPVRELKPPLPSALAATNRSNTTLKTDSLAGQPARPAVSENERDLSPWTMEIVKLVQADIEEDVLLTFIDNAGTFNLGADQIIHLHGLGVSSQFLIAMIQHDADLISGIRPLTSSTTPSSSYSIQVVLVPATNAPSNGGSLPAILPAVHEDSDLPKLSDLENPAANQNESALSTPQPATVPASKEKEKLYRVREPYPEQVTAPILVFKSAGLTPNTFLIEFSP